jgi:D-3-phosphoglycerate dehydrogenase
MDQVDRDTASALGIPIRNVPDYCTEEVSDHALALLLAAERRLIPFANRAAKGDWSLLDRTQIDAIRRLRGQTVGIVGAGRIGRLVARKARAFGFRTIASDPFLSDTGDHDLGLVPLHELMRESDAIVICASRDRAARPIIRDETLDLVKPGLILVNVARGGHIEESALAKALQDGRVGVAAVDVREPEPPDLSHDLLAGLPNVIQTPHVAAESWDSAQDLHRLAAEGVLHLLEIGGRIDPVNHG